MAAQKGGSDKQESILLLSSEPTVREVEAEILEDAGYTVQAAGDLGKAVDILGVGRTDLLVTHSFVAELSGREAANYLRGHNPGMKVLLVAGLPDDDRIRNWSGIDRIRIFPGLFAPADLVRAVGEIFKKPGR